MIWNVSIRRACDVLQVGRSIYHYKSRSASQAELRQRIKDIAASRVRYGYRRIHVLLRREGWDVNAKRVYRLYKEEGLQLRNSEANRHRFKGAEHRNGKSRQSSVKAVQSLRAAMMSGLWILSMTSPKMAARSVS